MLRSLFTTCRYVADLRILYISICTYIYIWLKHHDVTRRHPKSWFSGGIPFFKGFPGQWIIIAYICHSIFRETSIKHADQTPKAPKGRVPFPNDPSKPYGHMVVAARGRPESARRHVELNGLLANRLWRELFNEWFECNAVLNCRFRVSWLACSNKRTNQKRSRALAAVHHAWVTTWLWIDFVCKEGPTRWKGHGRRQYNYI